MKIKSIANNVKAFFSNYAITIGITTVGILIAHNAVVSYIGQKAIRERNKFEEIQLTVNQLIDTHSTLVNLMDLGLRGYFMMRKDNFIDPYNIAMEQYRNNLDTLATIMKRLDYPNLDKINYVKNQVSDYAGLTGKGIDYIKSGQPEQAVFLFEADPGYDLWMSSSPIMENIRGYVHNLNEQSRASYENISSYSLISQIITFIVGIPVIIIVLGFGFAS